VNQSVGPGVALSFSFTIHAGTNSTEVTCDVDFSADSSGDFETQEESTKVIVSVATLSIIKNAIEPFAADAIANTDGIIRIPIENTGFLTASEVVVTLTSAQAGTEFAEQLVTITVPAGEVAYAEFPYSDMPPGNARLVVSVTVDGTPVSEDVSDYEFPIKFSNVASEDGESPYLMVVIVALTLLVLYGGFKTARKGSSGRF
jgi:hypothetical protein